MSGVTMEERERMVRARMHDVGTHCASALDCARRMNPTGSDLIEFGLLRENLADIATVVMQTAVSPDIEARLAADSAHRRAIESEQAQQPRVGKPGPRKTCGNCLLGEQCARDGLNRPARRIPGLFGACEDWEEAPVSPAPSPSTATGAEAAPVVTVDEARKLPADLVRALQTVPEDVVAKYRWDPATAAPSATVPGPSPAPAAAGFEVTEAKLVEMVSDVVTDYYDYGARQDQCTRAIVRDVWPLLAVERKRAEEAEASIEIASAAGAAWKKRAVTAQAALTTARREAEEARDKATGWEMTAASNARIGRAAEQERDAARAEVERMRVAVERADMARGEAVAKAERAESASAYHERVAREVCAENVPWNCEEVCRETVDLVEWCRVNHPDALPPAPATAPKTEDADAEARELYEVGRDAGEFVKWEEATERCRRAFRAVAKHVAAAGQHVKVTT